MKTSLPPVRIHTTTQTKHKNIKINKSNKNPNRQNEQKQLKPEGTKRSRTKPNQMKPSKPKNLNKPRWTKPKQTKQNKINQNQTKQNWMKPDKIKSKANKNEPSHWHHLFKIIQVCSEKSFSIHMFGCQLIQYFIKSDLSIQKRANLANVHTDTEDMLTDINTHKHNKHSTTPVKYTFNMQ